MPLAIKYLGLRCPEDSAVKPWYFLGGMHLQEGQRFELDPEQWTLLGRSQDAEIRVASNGVARHHLRIKPTDEGTLLLEDLGGSNGTQVAGTWIERAELGIGEVFSLAHYFDFEVVDSGR